TCDVVVTTAAGAVWDPGSLERICAPFRDPTVGVATGRFSPRQDGLAASAGEGFYWRMEYGIMAAESALGILACASGTSMAHRRSIFRPIPADSDGDVAIAPNAVEQGYRTVFVPEVVVRDDGPVDMRGVLRDRRRMALRALPTTATFVGRLVRAGRLGAALGLASHKLLRWLVPFCLPVWAIAALALIARGDTGAALATAALVALAGVLLLATLAAGPRVRGAVWGFIAAQLAFALATVDAFRGRRARMWSREG
ncbi:MAG TPA: glycosyltransferase, partial [Candidatus Dormibacteraeota bacterium]|nr:glycosyltransferase [Candidatus Dormibacteraeota bacterium]